MSQGAPDDLAAARPRGGALFAGVVALALFAVLTLGNVALWRMDLRSQEGVHRDQARVVAVQTALRLGEFVDDRLGVLENLARRWRAAAVVDPVRFRSAALALHGIFPGYQAINWIDQKGVIRWVTPSEGNQGALGLDVAHHPIAGAFLRLAGRDFAPHATFPVPLAQGGTGVAIYRRIEPKPGDPPSVVAPQGYLNGVFRVEGIMERILGRGVTEAYEVRILDGDIEVYGRSAARRADWGLAGSETAKVADRQWEVIVAPAANLPRLNRLGLVVGLVTAAALAGLLWLLLRRQGALEERVWMRTAALEHEVVERRRAEQEALLASSAKSRFLANVSHELRTPLNAIIGFSEAIEAGVYGPPPDQRQTEAIGRVAASGRHLLAVINDILDIAKIEAGTLDIELGRAALADVVTEAAVLIEDQAKARGLTLTLPAPDDMPVVWGDDRRLKQVILNLLSNAVKFTPDGGAVTVAVDRDADGGARLSVSDTGIGMTAEEIDTALTPFGQVEGDLARRYEGTGLGLPLSRELLELMGAMLEVTSSPGEGTTVTVAFPSGLVVD